ncbi:hypothetical protein TYRP_019925 [Tyrophagus putrescentiae]|nr:hypothetical protein TYRP_019925 [Tyrophagus putrescentiae]
MSKSSNHRKKNGPGVDTLPESFSGPLLVNHLLNQAEHLFVNEIHGPEAFASFNGKYYTGLRDGRIVEVLPDRIETVAWLDPKKVGPEVCSKPYKFQCGRALGLRFDSKGTLYAVDPHHGVFAVNVQTGAIKLVVDTKEIGAKFLDDMVIIEKPGGAGMIFYLSDVSTRWDLNQAMFCAAEHDRTGRLLSYDTQTKKMTVEYENLAFPNGLELTDDKSALLLCSINDRLVYRYGISGPEKGKLVTILDNLPGEPDNIKRSADRTRETFWVGIYTARNKHRPHFAFDVVAKNVYLTRFIVRLQFIVGSVVEWYAKLVDSDCLLKIGVGFKSGLIPNMGHCEYGMALEIDAKGNILNSLHSPDGKTCALSEVFEMEDQNDGQRRFLLGSATNPYLGRLSLPVSAFRTASKLETKQKETVKLGETPKPVKTVESTPVKTKTAESKPPPQAKKTSQSAKASQTSEAKRDEL